MNLNQNLIGLQSTRITQLKLSLLLLRKISLIHQWNLFQKITFLKKRLRKALNNLKERDDVIFTEADKGGAVVIWDTKDYIEEAEQQLDNEKFYHKLNYCPTEEHSRLVSSTLHEFANNSELSKEIADGLKPVNAATPRFYLLPKIHKEGNPGRPVVSSVNSHTSNISKFVDHHIQPFAKVLRSYVKDTTDILTKIKDLGTV